MKVADDISRETFECEWVNDTNHCDILIYKRFSRILNMTFHKKIDEVIMQ